MSSVPNSSAPSLEKGSTLAEWNTHFKENTTLSFTEWARLYHHHRTSPYPCPRSMCPPHPPTVVLKHSFCVIRILPLYRNPELEDVWTKASKKEGGIPFIVRVDQSHVMMEIPRYFLTAWTNNTQIYALQISLVRYQIKPDMHVDPAKFVLEYIFPNLTTTDIWRLRKELEEVFEVVPVSSCHLMAKTRKHLWSMEEEKVLKLHQVYATHKPRDAGTYFWINRLSNEAYKAPTYTQLSTFMTQYHECLNLYLRKECEQFAIQFEMEFRVWQYDHQPVQDKEYLRDVFGQTRFGGWDSIPTVLKAHRKMTTIRGVCMHKQLPTFLHAWVQGILLPPPPPSPQTKQTKKKEHKRGIALPTPEVTSPEQKHLMKMGTCMDGDGKIENQQKQETPSNQMEEKESLLPQ